MTTTGRSCTSRCKTRNKKLDAGGCGSRTAHRFPLPKPRLCAPWILSCSVCASSCISNAIPTSLNVLRAWRIWNPNTRENRSGRGQKPLCKAFRTTSNLLWQCFELSILHYCCRARCCPQITTTETLVVSKISTYSTGNVDGQSNATRGIRGLLHLSNALAPLAGVLENSVQPPDAADVHAPRVASLVNQHKNRGAPAVPEEATVGGGEGGTIL